MPDIKPDQLLWILPVFYALAAGAALSTSRQTTWVCAEVLSFLGMIAAVSSGAFGMFLSLSGGPALDAAGDTMAVLVGLLGWIIVRYSRTYLDGEPGQENYVFALMMVLMAVAILVLSRNLAVILIAWSATSLALHKLLTFYPERPGAMLAAHKKFIVSRLAELCIGGALTLFYLAHHSLSLSRINALGTLQGPQGWMIQAAMLLVVAAVILKAAQLPFHGWLIQVMEAPTPVSALLHAGVVNIGGFILIRLAPLLAVSEAARTVLLVAGTSTAILAGLAMMTRVDIKTRLAWSTCAQMGFMLLECGLGLFPLAFLHLVAHSLYKAYGFLSAGESVNRATQGQLQPRSRVHSRGLQTLLRLLSAPLALTIAFALAHYAKSFVPGLHSPDIALFIVGLAAAPLLWANGKHAFRQLLLGLAMESAIVLLYLSWHLVFTRLDEATAAPLPPLATAFVAAAFCLMFVLQVVVQDYPGQRAIKRIHAWAYSGFFLDEAFNRLTQKVWPLKRTLRTTSALAFGIGKRIAGGYE